jgi:signal transduction histidine kinase
MQARDMENISNRKLLDELTKRINQNPDTAAIKEIARLEEETRQLGMRLRESENGKSQFLSNVRNEINNPLSAIMGLAASITGLTSEEKIRHMSQLIEKQAAELDFQMRNIIMAAEIEAGELTKNCSRVDVGSVVENQIAYLKHRINDHGTDIELSIDEQLKFRTDANILQIICLNLFSNAIEYCGSNKIVMIDVQRKTGLLELSVRDFGSGIDPALQSEIFQRFKQGETGLRKKHCGHGLGLCIVKELTTYLDGSIELDSSPERGTTIKVAIPEMPASELAENTLNFGNALLFAEGETF